jgi:hypothetical protein
VVLEATAKDDKGRELYKTQRIYMTQCTDSLGPVMVLGPDRKLGIIRDSTFQPFRPKREEFEIRLAGGIEAVDVELRLFYQLRPGDQIPIHHWQKRVPLAGLFTAK